MTATEKTIALRAVKAFQDATGLQADYRPGVVDGRKFPDGIVRIEHGNQALEFAAEIKRRINRTIIGLFNWEKLKLGRILLVTDYVNPELANDLKEQEIPFIDAAGNAFIKKPSLYVYIKGNKPTEEFKGDRTKRLFKPSGLRVLFVLLNHPGGENKPYRDIANEAGVALGTVGWVIYDLKDTGFIVDQGKAGRRLINKTDLLRRWVEAYPEQLRPKLVKDKFRVDTQLWWQDIIPTDFNAFWGGEIAAAKMTGYLKPEKFVIYSNEPPGKLVFKYKLQKDPKGNVEILKPFWNFHWKEAKTGIVPPLLVYADLMTTGDPRNIEAAEMIYDKHIAGLVRED
jgi:hypothetical protein